MKKNITILFFFLAVFIGNAQETLRINEVMSANASFSFPSVPENSDWIELYNYGTEDVSLAGWFLSDNQDDFEKWAFPNVNLAPDEVILVFATGLDVQSSFQTNFKISKKREALILSKNGTQISTFSGYCIPEDHSIVWNSTTEQYNYTNIPSPNHAAALGTLAPCTDQVVASTNGGFYASSFELEINSENGLPLAFTLDGSDPLQTDLVSSVNLTISPQFIGESDLSYIPTSVAWEEPSAFLPKASVVRAQSFYETCPVSAPLAETYFVQEETLENEGALLFSFTTEASGLFGEEGIFVAGRTGVNFLGKGEEWTREGHLEVYKTNGEKVINQIVEFKNRGQSSRGKPQKAVRFTAKSKFGSSTLDYPFFGQDKPQSFKSINLRTGMSSFTNSVIPDVLSEAVFEGMDIDQPDSRLAVMYINGEYWGVFDARENLDEHFVEAKYGYDKDAVTILKNDQIVLEGDGQDFEDLLSFIQISDLTDPLNFEYVASRIDLSNYIDYNIAHMYAANWDWPHNNVEWWTTRSVSTKYRWFNFDCDACFYKDSFNAMSLFSDPNTQDWDKILLSRLITNPNFKSRFTTRFYELLDTQFNPGRVISKLDSIEAAYAPFISAQVARWHFPARVQVWNNHVQEMRHFAMDRPNRMVTFLEDFMANPLQLYPNPCTSYLNAISMKHQPDASAIIYDFQGREIKSQIQFANGQLYVGDLPEGVYLIKVKLGDIYFTDRFIKK